MFPPQSAGFFRLRGGTLFWSVVNRMKRLLALSVASFAGNLAFASPANVLPPSRLAPVQLAPADQALGFMLEPPAATKGKLDLWATWYHMPVVRALETEANGSAPLLDRKGKAISANLSVRDWCDAAMQGSIWIETASGAREAFMFIDDKGPEQINCDTHFGQLSDGIKSATRRARFARFTHPRACDVRPRPLMPYRTVAVDPKRFRMGQVLFIPDLRGEAFWLEGELFVHDGYVVAGDRGGAIKGDHIDMFVADVARDPFPNVIKSHPRGKFEAYLVEADDPAALALRAGDDKTCDKPAPPASDTI